MHLSQRTNSEIIYKVSFLQYTDKMILMPYDYNINAIWARLKQIQSDNEQETGINHRILWCTFAGESEVIDIMDSAVLEGIKACLQNRDGPVTLEFADKEDESGKGNKIDKENNSENEDN